MPVKWIAALLLLALPARADALEHLEEALRKLDALELDAAEEEIGKALEAEPELAAAYAARARLRARRENPGGAAQDALKASELGEDLWEWAATLAKEANDNAREGRAAEGAFKKHGKPEHLKAAADAFAAAGDYRKAIEIYGKLTESGPEGWRAECRMHRGNLLSLCGDHAAGLEDLDAVLAAAPKDVRALQLRGRVKLRAGDAKGGLADYENAQRINSGEPSAYLILGLAYYDLGDYTRAATTLERATAFSRAHRYTHLYLFLARCRTGVPANRLRAKRELMGYLEKRTKQDDWFAALGGFLIGEVTEKELLDLAGKAPGDLKREQLCEAWGYVGQMAMIAGDAEKAVDCFRKAIETNVGTFMEYGSADMELRRIGKR
jgi:lipoprotein NlpI